MKINNKDKLIEERLKSEEDYAESISYELFNPLHMEIFAKKRNKFCVFWLKKRFPGLDSGRISQKLEEYFSFLDKLELN